MSYYRGTTQAMGQSLLAVHDTDSGGLYVPAFNWMYQQRSATVAFSPDFHAAWNQPELRDAAMFDHVHNSGTWAPWSDAVGGNSRPNFIVGQTLDSNGNPIAATVQGFRTSDDLYVGETGSDDNGRYALPTIYLTDAHYLVAYRVGSPDQTGATVNTLIPQSSPT